jgi:hypothetical protein
MHSFVLTLRQYEREIKKTGRQVDTWYKENVGGWK